ncbi:hypothetical protein DSO57_1003484 [Entomophthora muscae]|uniref:Uncharacterized protein n=1 Tax=Entomophthora muscae TaxID=34485 RepID=A0ACC2RNB8_9FUNG|nr:hypothetical protein DSO57_1003484 [Entomophthora muscae]
MYKQNSSSLASNSSLTGYYEFFLKALGKSSALVVISFGIFGALRNSSICYYVCSGSFTTQITTMFLKFYFKAPRPKDSIKTGFGLPSSHSAHAAFMCVFLAPLLLAEGIYRNYFPLILLFGWSFGVSYSRNSSTPE